MIFDFFLCKIFARSYFRVAAQDQYTIPKQNDIIRKFCQFLESLNVIKSFSYTFIGLF